MIQVQVYDADDNFIANVPRRRDVSWQEEHNTPGSGQFTIHADDQILVDHPDLLDYFNVVRFVVNGVARKAWLIEGVNTATVPEDETGKWIRVSGRGAMAILGNAVVYPEYTLRRDSADERSFDFGSAEGPWYDSSEWDVPVGVAKSSTSSIRYPYPKDWPDSFAQWIWSSPGPNSDTAVGYNWFRGGFSLTSETRVTIYAAGDDRLQLQLDGEIIIEAGDSQWLAPSTWTGTLAAGYHLIAAWVYNHGTTSGGLTAGGFICTVAKVDRNNKVLSILKRSAPTGFLVKAYGSAPGWFPAQILKKLCTEANTRNVAQFSIIDLGFTDTDDYTSVAWTQRHDRSFPIGSTDYLDLVNQLTELDIDVSMSPDLVLRAWKNRGTDRRNTVRLIPSVNVTSAEAEGIAGGIRNRALVRHRRGWIQANDSTSESTYGRRETGINLGGTDTDAQANRTATAAFADSAQPEETLTVTTTSEVGPQPYADYDIYDVVTAPGLTTLFQAGRVMTFTGTEDNDTGVVRYDHQLYPEA